MIHQFKTKEITTVKEVWILSFVSMEKIPQTLETVFHQLSKHFEFPQQCSAERRIFKSLLDVCGISGQNTVSRYIM